MSKTVAQFNGGQVNGADLAAVLRRFPDASLEVSDGWIHVCSDSLPTDHPINLLSDVVQVAWESGAIPDSRFNEAAAAVEALRELIQ